MKKIIKNRFKATVASFIILTLSIVALGGLMSRPVSAATDFKGMLISPASQNIDLKNGQTYTGQMQVQNTTDGDMNVNMSVGSYVMDDTSTPNYDTSGKYSVLKDWIRLDKTSFTLKSGGVETVTYTINTPTNPPSGMQYATILAENVPEESSTGITATTRIGMVIRAAMVDGETIERASIVSSDIPGYQPTAPLKANFAVKNEGNIGADVGYSLVVKSILNGRELYRSDEQSYSVYPETTHNFTLEWDQARIGIYRVEIRAIIDGTEQVISGIVWTIPLWIILLIVIAILCIIGYFALGRRDDKAKQSTKSKKK